MIHRARRSNIFQLGLNYFDARLILVENALHMLFQLNLNFRTAFGQDVVNQLITNNAANGGFRNVVDRLPLVHPAKVPFNLGVRSTGTSVWLDAGGVVLRPRDAAGRTPPFFPGFDTLGTLKRILATGHSHSWFILTQKIIEKEFALSGSEQNPDLTEGG